MKKWLSLFLCLALLAALPAARAEGALQAQDSDFTNSTVERVKSEILSAQITSSAEVLSVALDHLDADITVDGMTTTILDDGRLQITQILSPDNADEIAAHSGAAAGASDMACSTLLVVGPNGEEASSGSFEMEDSGGLNEYSVYAVHTAYFDLYEESFFDPIEVRTTKLSTKFTYGTSIRATSFYHAYMVEVGHYPEEYETYGSRSSPNPNYEYSDSVYGNWYSVGTFTVLYSYSYVQVGGTVFELKTVNALSDSIWEYLS